MFLYEVAGRLKESDATLRRVYLNFTQRSKVCIHTSMIEWGSAEAKTERAAKLRCPAPGTAYTEASNKGISTPSYFYLHLAGYWQVA